MTIEAKIITDSISSTGSRLTTFQLRYPRFIHSEFMTHRLFSRNASSSRAIPVERMIADLRRDPAMPVSWSRNQKGMQAGSELTEQEINVCKQIWLNSMENAIHSAEKMIELGLHKQVANRILEPWAHINVVCTASSYDNFFELRCHPDAQPEIKVLAELMRDAREVSLPEILLPSQWHLPYIPHWERDDIAQAAEPGRDWRNDWSQIHYDAMIKISVARCARVSYLTHDGRQTTIEEDLALYERLVGGVPLHASPAEHQATPDTWIDLNEVIHGEKTPEELHTGRNGDWANPDQHGNFTGWIQFRKQLEGQFA